MPISHPFSTESSSQKVIDASIGLRKRSASVLSIESGENEPSCVKINKKSTVSHFKRPQKVSRNSQFSIFEDETASPDCCSSDSYRELSPAHSAAQIEPIQSKIMVEIPFRPEIHRNSSSLYFLEPLQPISTNRGPRAKPIPKKWAKKQPNDHTSK